MWWERLHLWSKGFLLLPMKTMRIPARICLTSTSGEGRVFVLRSCAALHAAAMRGELPADSLPELLCPVHLFMHSLTCRHYPTKLHAVHLNGTVLDMCSVPQLQRGSQTEAAAAAPICCPYMWQNVVSSLLPSVQAGHQARRSRFSLSLPDGRPCRPRRQPGGLAVLLYCGAHAIHWKCRQRGEGCCGSCPATSCTQCHLSHCCPLVNEMWHGGLGPGVGLAAPLLAGGSEVSDFPGALLSQHTNLAQKKHSNFGSLLPNSSPTTSQEVLDKPPWHATLSDARQEPRLAGSDCVLMRGSPCSARCSSMPVRSLVHPRTCCWAPLACCFLQSPSRAPSSTQWLCAEVGLSLPAGSQPGADPCQPVQWPL